MVEQEPEAVRGADQTLAEVLDAWRAAERRLTTGEGNRLTVAAEVRRLREVYHRLEELAREHQLESDGDLLEDGVSPA